VRTRAAERPRAGTTRSALRVRRSSCCAIRGGAGGVVVGILKLISVDPGNTSDLTKISPPPS
jgi:hypothetical protein